MLCVTYFLREKAFAFAPSFAQKSTAISAVVMTFVTAYALFLVW
ncbi:MAG: hypothetical protein QMC36_06405 [Patescibacteria group bacterium]